MKVYIREGEAMELRSYVVVCIVRGRNRISYNSGLTYFHHKSSVDHFISQVKSVCPESEFIMIDPYEAKPPRGDKKGYWCPYCECWEYWVTDNWTGSKRCPICGISNNDYYVKGYNELWVGEMKNKKSKLKADRKERKSK